MHTEHSFEIIWSAEAEVPFVGLWCHNCSKYLEVREYPANSLVFYIASPLSAATPAEVSANMEKAKTYQQEVARMMMEDFPEETVHTYAPHATLPLELDDSDPCRPCSLRTDYLCWNAGRDRFCKRKQDSRLALQWEQHFCVLTKQKRCAFGYTAFCFAVDIVQNASYNNSILMYYP